MLQINLNEILLLGEFLIIAHLIFDLRKTAPRYLCYYKQNTENLSLELNNFKQFYWGKLLNVKQLKPHKGRSCYSCWFELSIASWLLVVVVPFVVVLISFSGPSPFCWRRWTFSVNETDIKMPIALQWHGCGSNFVEFFVDQKCLSCVTYVEKWLILCATFGAGRGMIFMCFHCIVVFSALCTLVNAVPLIIWHDVPSSCSLWL